LLGLVLACASGCGSRGGSEPSADNAFNAVAIDEGRLKLQVLRYLPDDTLYALVIPSLDQLERKAEQLASALDFPVPRLLRFLTPELGIEGIKQNEPVCFALVPTAGDEPGTEKICFLPVSDYQRFVAEFEANDAGSGISCIRLPGLKPFFVVEKN